MFLTGFEYGSRHLTCKRVVLVLVEQALNGHVVFQDVKGLVKRVPLNYDVKLIVL